MIKYKSTETGKEYDTLKEATEAEVALREKNKVDEEKARALNEAIKKAYDKMNETRKTLESARKAYQEAVDEYYATVDKRKTSRETFSAYDSFFKSIFG